MRLDLEILCIIWMLFGIHLYIHGHKMKYISFSIAVYLRYNSAGNRCQQNIWTQWHKFFCLHYIDNELYPIIYLLAVIFPQPWNNPPGHIVNVKFLSLCINFPPWDKYSSTFGLQCRICAPKTIYEIGSIHVPVMVRSRLVVNYLDDGRRILLHCDAMTMKCCPRCRPFVRGIHRWIPPHTESLIRSCCVFVAVLGKLLIKYTSCRWSRTTWRSCDVTSDGRSPWTTRMNKRA